LTQNRLFPDYQQMETIPLSTAKAHLGRYLRRAARGETFVLADRNRKLARLVPHEEPPTGIRPRLGILEGKGTVPDDFDAPLPEFERDFYGS
jgi:prevent-host-death family protein